MKILAGFDQQSSVILSKPHSRTGQEQAIMTDVEMKRDPGGRFVKGASGNPNGRPVGVKNYGTAQTLLELFRELTPLALSDLKDRYEAGDENAKEFILRRIWPDSPKFSVALHERARTVEIREARDLEIEMLKLKHSHELARLEEKHEEDLLGLEGEMERHEADIFHKLNDSIFRSKTKAVHELPDFFMTMLFSEIEEGKEKLRTLSASGSSLDDALLPSLSKLSAPHLSSFSHALIYGVIYEPDVVRESLQKLDWAENLINTVFDEIQKKYSRYSVRDMIAVSLIYPCLSSNKSKEEIEEILGSELDVGNGWDEDGKPSWEI